MSDTNRDNIIDLMNEITRLQSANEKLLLDNLELRNEAMRERSAWENVVADKHFEIERLRKQRELGNAALREAEELRKENEWLRKMLQVCMDKWIPFREVEFRKSVSEALGHE